MADEVILVEMRRATSRGSGVPLSVFGDVITTQVLDIATRSAALNAKTEIVQIISKGTGFWYRAGGSSVNAVADTDGNTWLGADKEHSLEVNGAVMTHIDTAADA